MRAREVVEREQLGPILGQTVGGFRIFIAIGRDEGVEGGLGVGPGLAMAFSKQTANTPNK